MNMICDKLDMIFQTLKGKEIENADALKTNRAFKIVT